MAPQQRLRRILEELSDKEVVGTLKLGSITYDVPASLTPSRLPRSKNLLDIQDPTNLDNLHFLLQKYLLGQDVFLVSHPGPYARRLALTFASIINAEYEYVALHRDVGETELKQGREIRQGGNLSYVDSATVRAVKHGRILIIEGIEKAERGIMPILNNLLENREMNLDDGTHIIHPHRYAQLESTGSIQEDMFIPAARSFRVIAIAAPVPPYPGFPLDPPLRSRFQGRFISPVGSLLALSNVVVESPIPNSSFLEKLRSVILATQYAGESGDVIETIFNSVLPPFPQTSLLKLQSLINVFPPPEHISPLQLARLLLVIHPGLGHAQFQAWALLSRHTETAGLGEITNPFIEGAEMEGGYFGYMVTRIDRAGERSSKITFQAPHRQDSVVVTVQAGPKTFRSFPFTGKLEFHPTPRFMGLLTRLLQAHALGWDIFLLPPPTFATASSSTSILVNVFSQLLGYETETVHLYKELGGRELVMRRKVEETGATTWEPSPITKSAWSGHLLHLDGIDVLGATAGSLARLVQDREFELWEGKRIVGEATENELQEGELSCAHPSFHIFGTATKSLPLKDWLSDELVNMFFYVPCQPMSLEEEKSILLETGCSESIIKTLLSFATIYRESLSAGDNQKNRKLGTRSLVRIARRFALYPSDDDLEAVISRSLLADFLPAAEQLTLYSLLKESGIEKRTPLYNPSPVVQGDNLVFPSANYLDRSIPPVSVPRFPASQDPEGVASHIPHMDHFYDNSLQAGLMRDLVIDLESLGEHLVLLGNQGVGKNKIVDRLCQLLGRPREYVQLHRDTTVNQLMFTTSLESGVIKYTDSPLLRAIIHGRVIIIDEADKAPEHVVAIFRSLSGKSEMTLFDGRRVCPVREREDDIAVHPNFRLILLANRPGYPFLGNQFLRVLGDNFSCHSIPNPDQESERKLLAQLAPELDDGILRRLIAAFQDLRQGYDKGILSYPYSLRELINLVRHLRAFPGDSLGVTLRNVFDFDVHKPDMINKVAEILEHHGLPGLKLKLENEDTKKPVLDIQFEPTNTELSEPKEGEHVPENVPHFGGNQGAGGTGGRDTAGLGGRGGFKRLYKGHNIRQVSDELKSSVPDYIRERARELARQELKLRLEELNMSPGDAKDYGQLLTAVHTHIDSLHHLLDNLAAREEERVWIGRQSDGELDDSRLTEGLAGEATVYKRRGMARPELGRPQIKPKRIRFIFDISGSIYRFQYDGRLQRSLEAAVMLMEAFARLSRKDKYVWDMYGHSGDSPLIPLVEVDDTPKNPQERWKVVEKMRTITQYAFSGDYTLESIEKGIAEIAKFDGDDWGVIAISDANFGRYQVTEDDLKRSMNLNPKVHTAIVCIGEGAEVSWVPKVLPGRGFRVMHTADIPAVMRSILSSMVDR